MQSLRDESIVILEVDKAPWKRDHIHNPRRLFQSSYFSSEELSLRDKQEGRYSLKKHWIIFLLKTQGWVVSICYQKSISCSLNSLELITLNSFEKIYFVKTISQLKKSKSIENPSVLIEFTYRIEIQ